MQNLDLNYENVLWNAGYKNIVGVDEVGRGALAGPLTVSAVAIKTGVLFPNNIKIRDSKKLTPKGRDRARVWICKNSDFALYSVSSGYIDERGIVQATQKAMSGAVEAVLAGMGPKVLVLSDAFKIKELRGIENEAIIKGDSKVFSIASASIVAKVFRDRLMLSLARMNLGYGWERNKGYGTKEHIRALRKYGTTKFHRKSFCKFGIR